MCDDSDEKQLLVVRQSGTTVVNMDSFIMHRSLRYNYLALRKNDFEWLPTLFHL